ncbi:MAG: radical SAM protein [bacterium]|nr:radical SAM protein [bacterium]
MRAFTEHPRDWAGNRYVYPVISRRSRGLSIGINLNPDGACNFDCVYCQVDRTGPARPGQVDLVLLKRELDEMLGWAVDGSLFTHPQFASVPADLHRVNDIAFSGDGEPTAVPVFAEAVKVAADLKRARRQEGVKIVLITNACYLTRPKVMSGLEIMDAANGEIWAKLDAGTQDHFKRVNRSTFTLAHVVENIIHAARARPLWIQSLWMGLDDTPPPPGEVLAFVERLMEILRGGGRLSGVQVYTVARQPAESFVAPLQDEEVEDIARTVESATGLAVARYYGAGTG